MAIDPDPRDWRLQAELSGLAEIEAAGAHRSHFLEGLLGRLERGDPDPRAGIETDAQAAVGSAVVVTHDGQELFAYAASRAIIEVARGALEKVFAQDAIKASITLSHWDAQHNLWAQIDPPLAEQAAAQLSGHERAEDVVETRTVVASSGRLDRAAFERSMTRYAEEIGVRCKIIEHPHLLTVQVGLELTGTRHKIDEFAAGMKRYGWESVRAELAIAASPL